MPFDPNPTDHIVRHDLDPAFVETVATRLPWDYEALDQELVRDPLLDEDQRHEEFGKRRGACAVRALLHACERHGVPFERLRLECNGQIKLLVRMGRIILMQEPIDAFGDPPKIADYKLALAETSCAVRQLEFDFGDGRCRSADWSGCILAVLLHKHAGSTYTSEGRRFGGLTLAIPDAAYSYWTRRFDLSEIAMHGRRGAGWLTGEPDPEPPPQPDNAYPTIRKKNANRATGR
ncbi:hypothetical protein [Methylobacterium sp. J-077]|uniref:hypothetical protein n=1 Tax=Methylobacterium sp. J-077 TaxID=2836656 RepID=UPI001FB9A175|nr:hypothetical protein [Methylobacterium sp. J-077]MCJ2125713.1 hypothetical protein [Methylobacterium sp. J-077]